MNALKEVTLIVLDEHDNHYDETNLNRLGRALWAEVILIHNRQDFEDAYNELGLDDKFLLVCHVFHTAEGGKAPLRGYYNLTNMDVEDDYKIKALLVSSGDGGSVMKGLYDTEKVNSSVYLYSSLRTDVKLGKILPYTKRKLEDDNSINSTTKKNVSRPDKIAPQKVDFAIITALYKDEFEEVEKHFQWTNENDYETATKRYRFGHLIGNSEVHVVAAIPSATGMVDAAIIATQMLELFSPKYLLMSGVCGGKKSLGFGDIVLASRVFTTQKGKLSDIRDGSGNLIELFDRDHKKVDYSHLYDSSGNQISVSVEKFQVEHDSIIEFDPLLRDWIEPELNRINGEINESLKSHGKTIKIHLEPVACSTFVVNKDGYFEENIETIDRKTVAVEMESYGLARAAKFANDGKTKAIIFKSVMDNMTTKDDVNKRFAAHTSALFLKHLIYDGILKV